MVRERLGVIDLAPHPSITDYSHFIFRTEVPLPNEVPTMGRRERNKQDKLQRIVAAAEVLFDRDGVDDVTTHKVAAEAGIATGTLFLYAKNKGELLLLVQTERYAAAVERGRAAAVETTSVMDGVLAIVWPVVETNRDRIDNGRSYLREMLFGDADEPHHASALEVVTVMQTSLADVLRRDAQISDPTTLSECIASVMFVTLAAGRNLALGVDEMVADIERQIRSFIS